MNKEEIYEVEVIGNEENAVIKSEKKEIKIPTKVAKTINSAIAVAESSLTESIKKWDALKKLEKTEANCKAAEKVRLEIYRVRRAISSTLKLEKDKFKTAAEWTAVYDNLKTSPLALLETEIKDFADFYKKQEEERIAKEQAEEQARKEKLNEERQKQWLAFTLPGETIPTNLGDKDQEAWEIAIAGKEVLYDKKLKEIEEQKVYEALKKIETDRKLIFAEYIDFWREKEYDLFNMKQADFDKELEVLRNLKTEFNNSHKDNKETLEKVAKMVSMATPFEKYWEKQYTTTDWEEMTKDDFNTIYKEWSYEKGLDDQLEAREKECEKFIGLKEYNADSYDYRNMKSTDYHRHTECWNLKLEMQNQAPAPAPTPAPIIEPEPISIAPTDKELIMGYMGEIMEIIKPNVKSDIAKAIVTNLAAYVSKMNDYTAKQCEKL